MGTQQPPLVDAQQLAWSCGGVAVQQGLGFQIRPGLAFVQGGEGRGKSSLLRLLAGQLQPDAGTLQCAARHTLFVQPADSAFDAVTAVEWLAALRPQFPDWDDDRAAAGVTDFALAEHIAKPMFMLSTGSRRKVGLVAASAACADLTLLDTPYAALDAASGRVLTRLLADAARQTQRAWVLADYALPQGLAGVALSLRLDLGD